VLAGRKLFDASLYHDKLTLTHQFLPINVSTILRSMSGSSKQVLSGAASKNVAALVIIAGLLFADSRERN
jgi:hypothetical protein